MRLVALSLFLVAVVSACGNPRKSITTPSDATTIVGTRSATEQLAAAFNRQIAASFKITYSATQPSLNDQATPTLVTERATVTWYKDGAARQRFDFQGVAYALQIDHASIFTVHEANKPWMVVCSDEIPATPTEPMTRKQSASCSQDYGLEDAAANLLYFLAFPIDNVASIGANPLSAQDLSMVTPDSTVTTMPQRSIAGTEAGCYEISTPAGQYTVYNDVQICFAPNGAPLYWHLQGPHLGNGVEVTATSVGQFDSADLAFPYPIDTPTPSPPEPTEASTDTPAPPVVAAPSTRTCVASDLAVDEQPTVGPPKVKLTTFHIRNASLSACRLSAPSLALLDAAGNVILDLPTADACAPSVDVGRCVNRAGVLMLPIDAASTPTYGNVSRGEATMLIAWSDASVGASCPTPVVATALRLTLPDNGGVIDTPFSVIACQAALSEFHGVR